MKKKCYMKNKSFAVIISL